MNLILTTFSLSSLSTTTHSERSTSPRKYFSFFFLFLVILTFVLSAASTSGYGKLNFISCFTGTIESKRLDWVVWKGRRAVYDTLIFFALPIYFFLFVLFSTSSLDYYFFPLLCSSISIERNHINDSWLPFLFGGQSKKKDRRLRFFFFWESLFLI